MSNSSGDENDSRTASVGLQRPHSNGSSGASRQSSRDQRIGKKQARRKGRVGHTDVRDFVPQGGTFSAAALEVDPDSAESADSADTASSSGSSSSDSEDESGSEQEKSSESQKPLGSVPVAINWNKGSRSTIRTSLTGKTSRPGGNASTTAFESVNGKYWRSRSASVSSEESQGHTQADGRADGDRARADQKPYFVDDSDGSETGEVSEGGDSIMLNLGGNDEAGLDRAGDEPPAESEPFRIDTQPDPGFVTANGSADHSALETDGMEKPSRSKEDAFRILSEKYSTPPSILADLNVKDLEIQARHFFYNRSIHDIDLKQPIACTECLQEGHLAIVCPTKECEHCGAWDLHESNFCPSWRRCQKCRERGHDANSCNSALKGSAAEVPCDYCGADTHLEDECDIMWKFPRHPPFPGPIVVSISCSYCTSQHHLMGDCPSLPGPTRSSSWTLKGYDPAMITNLNDVLGPRPVAGRTTMNGSNKGGMKIKGRAGPRSPTPDSDDDNHNLLDHPGRRDPASSRNAGRPNIRIGSGIGKNRNLSGGPPPQQQNNGGRQPYRDRQNGPGASQHRQQQRSLSPGRRSHPPPPRRGGGRGGRREAYRPMPSAGKKAWDKFRL
ncbi:hypothetical protein VTN77DRAFT_3906 [Rasamsonia byssochlamydoides]|uniref:uncharacterized protein n=1 Tax=Rasamsonia byssochlamydoides TaxID=89139 RepID=UPI003743EC0E